jgi:hypothetical protein
MEFWLNVTVWPVAPITTRVNVEFRAGMWPVGTVGLAQLLAVVMAAAAGRPATSVTLKTASEISVITAPADNRI